MSLAKNLGVIILGAGASSRMGRPKLLLPWKDTTVIGQILRQWRELGAAQIAVVLRPHDEALIEAIRREGGLECGDTSPLSNDATCRVGSKRGHVRALQRDRALQRFSTSIDFIVNPQPERGMFSSVICAASWAGWRKEISHWAIVLGDQPHLQTATLRALLNFATQNPGAICQPQFGDHGRHPVILPRAAFAALRTTRAETLKDFLKLVSCRSVQCMANDSGLALDLDTPDDYNRAKASI